MTATLTHCLGIDHGYRGPGNAGSDSCHCGFTLSWPDGTDDEWRDALEATMAAHLADCAAVDAEWYTLLEQMTTGEPAESVADQLGIFARLHRDRVEQLLRENEPVEYFDDWDES